MNEHHQASLALETIYLDDDIIIINKPSGLRSVPDGYNPNLPHLRTVLEPKYGLLWMVHRLDKETSGLVILARNETAHQILNASFRNREIEKFYHGLVTPVPEFRELVIELPLLPDADRKHRTRVNLSQGKQAISICRVLKSFHLGALLEIRILTGITHQIRAHLRAHDLALFGETLYNTGLPPQPITAPRIMLHARQITFKHPILRKTINALAPYPEDFRNLYTALRSTRAQDELI